MQTRKAGPPLALPEATTSGPSPADWLFRTAPVRGVDERLQHLRHAIVIVAHRGGPSVLVGQGQHLRPCISHHHRLPGVFEHRLVVEVVPDGHHLGWLQTERANVIRKRGALGAMGRKQVQNAQTHVPRIRCDAW